MVQKGRFTGPTREQQAVPVAAILTATAYRRGQGLKDIVGVSGRLDSYWCTRVVATLVEGVGVVRGI